jgi:putative oxidoreductase
MNLVFTLGRIALVLMFVYSGAVKLLDIAGTGASIASKITIPPEINDAVSQIVATVGLPIDQILAIIIGVIEVVAGLLIAFNVLTRTAAVVLLIFMALTVFHYHDFWNLQGPERQDQMIHAMKNLSIMGAFLILIAWPRRLVDRWVGDEPNP